MRCICYFGFSVDEGSRREQGNSQTGQFPTQQCRVPEVSDEEVSVLTVGLSPITGHLNWHLYGQTHGKGVTSRMFVNGVISY